MFLSDRLNFHSQLAEQESAQRTLAGEGISTLPRDVEIVNRLKCASIRPARLALDCRRQQREGEQAMCRPQQPSVEPQGESRRRRPGGGPTTLRQTFERATAKP